MKAVPSLPFISVIVPTRNRLALLRQTLGCLARQSLPADQYEIIVVDDGSEDGTAGYLSQLVEQGRLRSLYGPRRGPGAARNAGVGIARGEIVVFTDDDCLPEADWLAAFAAAYRSEGMHVPVAVGGQIQNVTDGHWLYAFQAVQNHHQANSVESPPYLDTANASFRRSIFLKVGGFNESFASGSGEDVDLGFRLAAGGYELTTTPGAVVRHVGRTSICHVLRQSFSRGRGNAVLMFHYPEFFSGPPSGELRLLCRRLLDRLVRWAWELPQPVQPPTCGFAASLRRGAFDIIGIGHYMRKTLPGQVHRCRTLDVPWPHKLLFLSMVCCDHLVCLAGQVIETGRYFYQQAHAGRHLA